MVKDSPCLGGKEIYKILTSNKIILAAQENPKIHNFRHKKGKKIP